MSVPIHAALVVALLATITCHASAVPYRTVVVFGDTQALVVERAADPSESYLRFLEMTRWVAEHRESENIDFVLHVGVMHPNRVASLISNFAEELGP